MLKKKDYKRINLQELGNFLEELGQGLKEGKLTWGNENWPLKPSELKVKWEIKIGKKEVKFKLSFQGDTYSEEENLVSERLTSNKKRKRPLESKYLKKEMGSIWKVIKRDVKNQNLPSLQDVNALIAVMENYNQYVEATWLADWIQCLEKVKLLKHAVTNQDFSYVTELVDLISVLEKACHKKYK